MRIVVLLLIIVIGLAATFGIAAVILEFHALKPVYEILMKACYILIGIVGAVLAWLTFLKRK